MQQGVTLKIPRFWYTSKVVGVFLWNSEKVLVIKLRYTKTICVFNFSHS